MPFTVEHGSAAGLLSVAAQAGRAEARARRFAGEQRLALATVAAKQQKDELRLREKALVLQTAGARRTDFIRQEDLKLRQRSQDLAEQREERLAKPKQSVVTTETQAALDWLEQEKQTGSLDDRAYRTIRVGVLTGNKSLVSEGVRRHQTRRIADEKARATAIEDDAKYHRILKDQRATVGQKTQAALVLTRLQARSDKRWGADWKSRPMEFYAPDFTESLGMDRETQRITAKPLPYDRKDLKVGQVYQLPNGTLASWTGSRFRVVGEPQVAKPK
jgi:hypothetical protein